MNLYVITIITPFNRQRSMVTQYATLAKNELGALHNLRQDEITIASADRITVKPIKDHTVKVLSLSAMTRNMIEYQTEGSTMTLTGDQYLASSNN